MSHTTEHRVSQERERAGGRMKKKEAAHLSRRSRKIQRNYGLEAVDTHMPHSGTSVAGRREELRKATTGYPEGKGGYTETSYTNKP